MFLLRGSDSINRLAGFFINAEIDSYLILERESGADGRSGIKSTGSRTVEVIRWSWRNIDLASAIALKIERYRPSWRWPFIRVSVSPALDGLKHLTVLANNATVFNPLLQSSWHLVPANDWNTSSRSLFHRNLPESHQCVSSDT